MALIIKFIDYLKNKPSKCRKSTHTEYKSKYQGQIFLLTQKKYIQVYVNQLI